MEIVTCLFSIACAKIASHQVEAARSGTYVDVHEYLAEVASTTPALKRGHHGTDAPHVYGWRICGCA